MFVKRLSLAVLVAGLGVAGLPGLAPPAHAVASLQSPVGFVSSSSPSYQTNGIAFAVAQSSGKVFVGGTFSSVRPAGSAQGTNETARANLVVLDAQTGAPTTCAPAVSGTATTGNPIAVRSLTTSPDGATLYIGGFFSDVGGTHVDDLAALDIATCTVVQAFAPEPGGTVRTILATRGTVYFGGDFNTAASVSRQHAAAAAAVGTATPGSVLPWGPSFDLPVRALAISPDGTGVVVGGDFNTANGRLTHALVVVDPVSGASNFVFPDGFIPAKSVVKDLAVDSTGFYTGQEGTGSGVLDGRIAINWTSYTQRWRDTCLGATQAVVVYQSVLYSGSHAHDCSSMGEYPNGSRHHLLAESVNSPALLAWFPQTNDGLGEAVGPRDMVVAPTTASGDQLWVVGEFTTVNGIAQQGITRFGQGPDITAPSVATTGASSPAPGQVRVVWRQSLDTDDASLTYRVYRDGSSAPLQTLQGTSWFWQRPQLAFTDSGLTPGSTHTYRVDATDGTSTTRGATRSVTVASSASAYASRVVADGASSLWRYDDPCDVFVSDYTSSNASGTLLGSSSCSEPGAVTGDPSRARTLTGTTTTIYSEQVSTFASTTALTAETWLKTTTTNGGKIIGVGDGQDHPSAQYDKQIYMTNSGQLVFGVWSAGNAVTVQTTAAYNDGSWHQVAASLGAAGMVLYVDGAKVASNTTVTTSQPYLRGYWRVGGDSLSNAWPNTPSSAFWTGSLDETATYPLALSATSVHAHYALATGIG